MIAELLLAALLGRDSAKRVTIDDVEAKFRELKGSVPSPGEAAKMPVVGGGVAGVVLLILLVYFLGRRRGRKRATVLEIRRII